MKEQPFKTINKESVQLEIANDAEEGKWIDQIAEEISGSTNGALESVIEKLVEKYLDRVRASDQVKKLIKNSVSLGWNQLADDAELNINIDENDRLKLSLTFGCEHAQGHYIVDFDLAGLLEHEFQIWDETAIPSLEKLRDAINQIISKLLR